MAKKRKTGKGFPNDQDHLIPRVGVSFDIEPDAAEIFAHYIDQEKNFGAGKKGIEAEPLPPRAGNKSPSKPGLLFFEIDLHGKTEIEAKTFLDDQVRGLFQPLQKAGGALKVRVITGKGLHSPDGKGLLIQAVYQHVLRTYREQIEKIDAPPAETLLSGVPIRGHFDVMFKIRKTGK